MHFHVSRLASDSADVTLLQSLLESALSVGGDATLLGVPAFEGGGVFFSGRYLNIITLAETIV